jgi:D-alanyl-D-alanine carboxypeptidase (penicillin-binding protein 5/6)
MRSWWCMGLAVAVGVACATGASAREPHVTAKAAVVIDAASGETLWAQNADVPLPPASTTKVMTAVLALESGRLGDVLAVSANAAATAPSKLGLRPGQRVELRDLLYAVLLKSANDAAVVVAEGLGGSEEGFAARMNAKARALGAVHSHFENPHGLTAPGHVVTAHDLARIFRYALHVPGFRDILETPAAQVPVQSTRTQLFAVRSHNRLLQGWRHQVIGKTGYTRPAKRCFVGAASNGEREVIVAVLGSTDLWTDTRRLVSFGLGEEDDTVPVLRARREELRAPKTRVATLRAPRRPTKRTKQTQVARARQARPVAEGDEGEAESTSARWAVQLGPFDDRHQLAKTRIALAHHGFRSDAVGSAIRLGVFPSRPSANRLATRLQRQGYRPTVVALK